MNATKEFNLLLFSLKDKVHEFSFTVDEKFFKCFENSPVEDGNFEVKVILNKSESLLQLEFQINGVAKLACDRTLESFDFSIQKVSKILFKFGQEYEEISDDVIILKQGTAELNISTWIYELIAVEIPYKKLHPSQIEDDEDLDWEDESNLQLVYSDVDEEQENEADQNAEISEETSKEVWEELKKKFNKE